MDNTQNTRYYLCIKWCWNPGSVWLLCQALFPWCLLRQAVDSTKCGLNSPEQFPKNNRFQNFCQRNDGFLQLEGRTADGKHYNQPTAMKTRTRQSNCIHENETTEHAQNSNLDNMEYKKPGRQILPWKCRFCDIVAQTFEQWTLSFQTDVELNCCVLLIEILSI